MDLDPFVPVSGQYECFLTCFIIIMNLNAVNAVKVNAVNVIIMYNNNYDIVQYRSS